MSSATVSNGSAVLGTMLNSLKPMRGQVEMLKSTPFSSWMVRPWNSMGSKVRCSVSEWKPTICMWGWRSVPPDMGPKFLKKITVSYFPESCIFCQWRTPKRMSLCMCSAE